jgi:secondary thiamine-phosphate synthase enzyme
MMWHQIEIKLSPKKRGFHLVTSELLKALPAVKNINIGILHLFIKHTSASLTINENADPDVKKDLLMAIDRVVPESWPYEHSAEGSDDMPAHVKSSLMGSSLSIPLGSGRLNLGTWQGIYLVEHRDRGTARTVVATIFGQSI